MPFITGGGSGGSSGGGGAGSTSLVYRYTVAGADKASVDTGVDTPDAGSNDWTNGDLLEIWITCRTDEASASSAITVTLNNDTGANYYIQVQTAAATTVSASTNLASAGWTNLDVHGTASSNSMPGVNYMTIPAYAQTTFFKTMRIIGGMNDSGASNNEARSYTATWANTAAVTRLKMGGAGAVKLKVGSQLLIYKRLAS
jgi:hypothetical protein